MRAALAPHDLTHVQFVLLATAWWLGRGAEGAPTQAALAGHAGTDAMMTSQVLGRLQERGLITRRRDPRDSRARVVSVTAAGGEALQGALGAVEDADAAFFANVGPDAHETLLATLRALAG